MAELIKNGTFPYLPVVQSWLCIQLGKTVSEITEAEAKALVQ